MRDKNVRLQVEQLEDRSVPSSICSEVNTWDDYAKSEPKVAGVTSSDGAAALPGFDQIFGFAVGFGFGQGCDQTNQTWPPLS